MSANGASMVVRRLAGRGTLHRFRRGEALFSQGDIAGQLFIVRDGWVKVACSTPDGHEVVLAVRGPGDILGELSTVDQGARSSNGVALTPVEAVVVRTVEVERGLQEEPALARELLGVVSARLRDADAKRVEFTTLTIIGRLAARLLELGTRFGEATAAGTRVDLPISQEEMASWCGASREATVKALRTLRELGLITTGRHTVVLHDIGALRRYAAPPTG